MSEKRKLYAHLINKTEIDLDGLNPALCGYQVSEIRNDSDRELCPKCKDILDQMVEVKEVHMPEGVEATIIEIKGEIPVMLGQFMIGTATVYEDRSMVVRFEEAYIGEELYSGVLNGAPMALTVQTVG